MKYIVRTVSSGNDQTQEAELLEAMRTAEEFEQAGKAKYEVSLAAAGNVFELKTGDIRQAAFLAHATSSALTPMNTNDVALRAHLKIHDVAALIKSASHTDQSAPDSLVGSAGEHLDAVPDHVESMVNRVRDINKQLARERQLKLFDEKHFSFRNLDHSLVKSNLLKLKSNFNFNKIIGACANSRFNRFERSHLVVAFFEAAYDHGRKLASEGKSPDALEEKYASAMKEIKTVLGDRDRIVEMMICDKVSEMQRERRITAYAHMCIHSGWEHEGQSKAVNPLLALSPMASLREEKKRTSEATNKRVEDGSAAQIRDWMRAQRLAGRNLMDSDVISESVKLFGHTKQHHYNQRTIVLSKPVEKMPANKR